MFERLWLTVAKLGLSLQPLTGVLFFTRGIEAGETSKFSPEQSPTARASRYELEKFIIICYTSGSNRTLKGSVCLTLGRDN